MTNRQNRHPGQRALGQSIATARVAALLRTVAVGVFVSSPNQLNPPCQNVQLYYCSSYYHLLLDRIVNGDWV